MKKVLFVLMMFFASFCWGQQFDGVEIFGSLSSVISSFKSKGYVVKSYINSHDALLKGYFLGDYIEIYVFSTPKTKKVCKVSIFFPKEETWDALKGSFYKFNDILSSKYNEPDNKYEYFEKPYFDGDDYELSAVVLGKSHFSCFWFNRNNVSIGLLVSKWKQIEIDYENDEMMKLNKAESDYIMKYSL